jgi:hypothetical protein
MVTNVPHTQYTLCFLTLDVACAKSVEGIRKRLYFRLVASGPKESHRQSSLVNTALRFTSSTSALVSHMPFLIENMECKIQNHLTSEACIFCLPHCRLAICTMQDVRKPKHYVYGGPVRSQESLDLCQSLWRHAVTSVAKMREQLRDWAKASVCQSVDGSRTLWGKCCVCMRGGIKSSVYALITLFFRLKSALNISDVLSSHRETVSRLLCSGVRSFLSLFQTVRMSNLFRVQLEFFFLSWTLSSSPSFRFARLFSSILKMCSYIFFSCLLIPKALEVSNLPCLSVFLSMSRKVYRFNNLGKFISSDLFDSRWGDFFKFT